MYNVCTIICTHIRSQASDWNCCVKRLFVCAQQSTSLILLYKMILSVCVQAGQRKLPDRFAKFFLEVIDLSMEIVKKIVKFYKS